MTPPGWTVYDEADPETWPDVSAACWVIVSGDGYQTSPAVFWPGAPSCLPTWECADLGPDPRWWCAPPDGPLSGGAS